MHRKNLARECISEVAQLEKMAGVQASQVKAEIESSAAIKNVFENIINAGASATITLQSRL